MPVLKQKPICQEYMKIEIAQWMWDKTWKKQFDKRTWRIVVSVAETNERKDQIVC